MPNAAPMLPCSCSFRRRLETCFFACLMSIGLPSVLVAENAPLPEQHFSVTEPANLSPSETQAVYEQIIDDMIAAYRMSRDPSASDYAAWRRFNKTPYPSATHGGRYVNNYGNALAGPYGSSDEPVTMPEGAVLAKDSFAVTADGNVFPGPLFLMEKMAPGFDATSRDWRYSMILPDGSFFGITGGDNAESVQFCITCHAAAGDDSDHLFFVPEDFKAHD